MWFSLWQKAPALWVALGLILGLACATGSYGAVLPALLILYSLSHSKKMIFILLFTGSFIFAQKFYLFPEKDATGLGRFAISSMRYIERRGWYYKGTLLEFKENDRFI